MACECVGYFYVDNGLVACGDRWYTKRSNHNH